MQGKFGRFIRLRGARPRDDQARDTEIRDPDPLVRRHRDVALEYPISPVDPGTTDSLGRSLLHAMARPPSAYRPLDRAAIGTMLARLGRSEEALSWLDSAAAAGPAAGFLHQNRGIVLIELFRNDAAARELAPLAAEPDASLSTRLASGVALMRSGQNDAALRQFGACLREHPRDTWILSRIIEAKDSKGQFAEVEQLRAESLRHRRDLSIRLRFGRALLRSGARDEALQISEELLARGGTDPATLQFRAQVLSKVGEADGAAATIVSAIELAPQAGQLRHTACQVLSAAGRLDEALAQADRACSLMPGNVGMLVARAFVLERLFRTEEALRDLGQAMRLDPADDWLVFLRARVLEGGRRYEEALETLARASNPGDPGLLVRRASVLISMGRLLEALNVCDGALAAYPEDADLFATRARVLCLEKRLDEGFLSVERAIELDPTEAYQYIVRAEILAGMERPDEALSDIECAIKLDPTAPQPPFARGEILEMLGMGVQALEAYDRSWKLYRDPRTLERRDLVAARLAQGT